jgi:AraC-like DNA-binding protein
MSQISGTIYQNPSGTFLLSTRKALGHYNMQSNHFHDQYELYYLLAGERYYFIKDRTYFVRKGGLIFINANELHKTTDTGVPDHERIMVRFAENFIDGGRHPMIDLLVDFEKKIPCLIELPVRNQQQVEDLLQRMLREIEQQEAGFEAILQALLIQLLIYIYRYSRNLQTGSFRHLSPVHEKISEVVQYINGHFQEPVTLGLLSREFYISPFYLSRVFKEVTGFTFIEYLNTLRIKEAQRLLRETGAKVIVISEQAGFGNIAHFGRIFKKLTGLSPLQYKKLYRRS